MFLGLFGGFPSGRAFRCNLFVRASKKGFSLQLSEAVSRILICKSKIELIIPNAEVSFEMFLGVFGRFPLGRAFRCNLFSRASKKGFSLQSLTRKL